MAHKEEIISRILIALEEEFDDAEKVGRVGGEDSIGIDIEGDTWFVEIVQA